MNSRPAIHKTAEISPLAKVGKNTKIWHQAQVREGVKIGTNCIIGKGVYIDKGVKIGNNCKIQNYACLYHESILEDGVFIGPHVCLTNDKLPRAISPNGELKSEKDWKIGKIIVHKGASIGTGTIVITDVEIGKFAMIGAGSVITKDVPAQALVYGTPGEVKGYICKCGEIISKGMIKPKILTCKKHTKRKSR